MANELVLEMGDMAVDIITAQLTYWTAALEQAKRQLDMSAS